MSVDRKRRARLQRRRDFGPTGEGKYITAGPRVPDEERAQVRDIIYSGLVVMKNAAARGELTEAFKDFQL